MQCVTQTCTQLLHRRHSRAQHNYALLFPTNCALAKRQTTTVFKSQYQTQHHYKKCSKATQSAAVGSEEVAAQRWLTQKSAPRKRQRHTFLLTGLICARVDTDSRGGAPCARNHGASPPEWLPWWWAHRRAPRRSAESRGQTPRVDRCCTRPKSSIVASCAAPVLRYLRKVARQRDSQRRAQNQHNGPEGATVARLLKQTNRR